MQQSKKGRIYRAVVDQGHFHHGLKDSILDSVWSMTLADLLDEVAIYGVGFGAGHGSMKMRLIALFRRGQESELRYWKP
jgi:hypothetical protein